MLQGKAAVATGAGHGIGRATSLAFAQAGPRLLVVDRDESSLEECVALITDTSAGFVNGVGWPVDGDVLAVTSNPVE